MVDVDGLEERLRRLGADVEAARERAASAGEFRRGLESVRGRGRCDGVEVVVDSSGSLVGLDLGRDLNDVRDAVLRAYGEARRDAGRAVVGLAGDAFGVDDPSVGRLRETYGITGEESGGGEVRGSARLGVLRPGGSW